MFTISAVDDSDSAAEGLAVWVYVNGYLAGSQTLSLTTDPAFTFGATTYTATEGGTAATVEVNLPAAPTSAVTIPIEVKSRNGGAVAADHSTVPTSLTFSTSDVTKIITVTATDDTVDDDGESITIGFGTAPTDYFAVGTTTVFLADNDDPNTVTFGAATYTAIEGGTPATVTVQLSRAPAASVTIPLALWRYHNDATSADHSALPQSVTFTTSDTSKTFTVTATDATEDDHDDESVTIGFGSSIPAGFAASGTTTVNLVDNDGTALVSNIAFRSAGGVTPDSAQAFTTGTHTAGYTLTSVDVFLHAGDNSPVPGVNLISGTAPHTGTATTLTGPTSLDPRVTKTYRFTAPTSTTLTASTTYWILVDMPSPADHGSGHGTTASADEDTTKDGWTISNNRLWRAADATGSFSTTTNPVRMQLSGHRVTVLEQAAANVPAEGAPAINGAAEVGQTLSAVTTGITDDDGLQNVAFTYQWLSDDAEISGATNSTYTLASDDLGKAIKVKVDFTDDAGNEESLTSVPTTAVTAAQDLELQSATAEGSSLTLTYNATLEVGVTLSSTAFTVNVNGSSRTIMGVGVGGSNVLLLLHPAVESGDTVTVDYAKPSGANVIKDTQDREADSFTAQAVTNNTAAPVTEKSDPVQAPGSLTVNRHESGKLTASWDAPGSGPTPTGYTVQWRESGDDWAAPSDVSESDVTGTSHTIAGLTDGTEYSVRVKARKGDDDSDPSAEVTATPQETVAPAPSSAAVDGATLTITFSEALDTAQTPDKSAFTVNVAGSSRGVDTVSVSGSAVTLTLVTAVSSEDAVTVDYTAPSDESAVRLQDLAGNAAASFSGQAVTNSTAAVIRLTASVSAVPGSHDGSGTFTFELRLSEEPHDDFSYTTMKNHAFTGTGGEVTKADRLNRPSNVGWKIYVTPDGDGTVNIVLPATTDCEAVGAICTEDGRMLSTRVEITVPGPVG